LFALMRQPPSAGHPLQQRQRLAILRTRDEPATVQVGKYRTAGRALGDVRDAFDITAPPKNRMEHRASQRQMPTGFRHEGGIDLRSPIDAQRLG
jgi:hypothetical protein